MSCKAPRDEEQAPVGIVFERAPLALPPIAEPELAPAPPRLPRAQLALWPSIPIVLATPRKKKSTDAELFRAWLQRDPATLDYDEAVVLVRQFTEWKLEGQVRRIDNRQTAWPVHAVRIAKPRSMGDRPTRAEKKSWVKDVQLPDGKWTCSLPVFPATRADCPKTRPCTFFRCRHHLKYEVNPDSGVLKDLFPGIPLHRMPHTCALDVAEEGDHTLEQVGAHLSVVLEWVRREADDAIDEYAAKLDISHEKAVEILQIASAL